MILDFNNKLLELMVSRPWLLRNPFNLSFTHALVQEITLSDVTHNMSKETIFYIVISNPLHAYYIEIRFYWTVLNYNNLYIPT